jgi:hypothetical protein
MGRAWKRLTHIVMCLVTFDAATNNIAGTIPPEIGGLLRLGKLCFLADKFLEYALILICSSSF